MTTDYSSSLGNNIRVIREEREIALRELARRAHVSPSYLNDVEKGRFEPTASKIHRIAMGLKVPLSKLLPEQSLDG
jgi:transcriptional regulator with XRE-family HTH domain